MCNKYIDEYVLLDRLLLMMTDKVSKHVNKLTLYNEG